MKLMVLECPGEEDELDIMRQPNVLGVVTHVELRVTDHIVGQVKQLEEDLLGEWDETFESTVVNGNVRQCPSVGVHPNIKLRLCQRLQSTTCNGQTGKETVLCRLQ